MVQSREEALGSVEKLVQHAKTLEKKYSDKVNSGLDCVFSFRQETKTAGQYKRQGETCRASHAKGELKLHLARECVLSPLSLTTCLPLTFQNNI